MKEFLHIEGAEPLTPESFIAEMVDMPVDEVKEVIDIYEEDLDELKKNNIKYGSKLLEVANHLSLLAIVAYAYKNDLELDAWLQEYAAKNNMFCQDQRKNFNVMVQSLNTYNQRTEVA